MRILFTLVLVALFTILLPANAHDAPVNDDADAVRKVLAEYKSALERLDLDGVDRLFHDDNRVVENGKLEGAYADYLAHHIGPELGHFRSFKFSDYTVDVNVLGDTAWALETYRYTIVLKDEDRTIERQGVATSVFRKLGADWRIVQMHGSSRAPKPAAQG